ncbi:MAG: hypothetical protein ACREF8_01500, partial [Chthoniobacterales bacterium]
RVVRVFVAMAVLLASPSSLHLLAWEFPRTKTVNLYEAEPTLRRPARVRAVFRAQERRVILGERGSLRIKVLSCGPV